MRKANARALASFEGGDSWVEILIKNGVALDRDAAATSDPSFVRNVVTLRDARVLRDALLNHSDWDTPATVRGAARLLLSHMPFVLSGSGNCFRSSRGGCAAAAASDATHRRGSTRVPDHLFGGPDLPADESVRLRFFGES